MRLASSPPGALLGFLFALMLVAGAPASAHEFDLRGLVLAVEPAKGQAVIRFEPTIDLPSRIVTFDIRPPSAAKSLRVGQTIRGTGDDDGATWSLRGLKITGTQSVTGATADQSAITPADVLRDVHHLSTGEQVPDTRFIDQRGKPFEFAMLRGSPVVLAFVYTRCEDQRECPLISAKFHALQSLVHDSNVKLVEVTLDPVYDTPGVLARYGRTFGADPARWTLATGDPNTVLNFAAQFQVTAFPDERVGLIHPERTILIDRDGTIRQMIDETAWAPDELVAQIRDDENLASNPFLRFNLWLSSRATAICGNAVSSFSGSKDLLIVLAIFAAFGYGLYRIARSLAKAPS